MAGTPADRTAIRGVLLLAGASGSGKSLVADSLGVPVIRLDDFYRDLDEPLLPRRRGLVDWDDVATWNAQAATEALIAACQLDQITVPVYDIPTSRRTGQRTVTLTGAPLIAAEGIFADAVVANLRAAGVLAGAYFLHQPRFTTAYRRFARDVGESRKPWWTLARRGLALWRAEPRLTRQWERAGLVPLPRRGAEARLREEFLANDDE